MFNSISFKKKKKKQHHHRSSLQHYYETFQDFSNIVKGNGNKADCKNGMMDDLVLLYAAFSANQAKDKAVRYGSLLHLRRERKMFAPFNVFWLNRSCWVGIIF